MRRTADRSEARIGQAIGKPAAGFRQRQRVALAGHDERRLRDAADLGAKVDLPQEREGALERRPRRHAAREELVAKLRERGARVLAALQLQREKPLDRKAPRDAELVAEPGERIGRHRVRPIVARDEPRRRRDEDDATYALRPGERPVHRDLPAERPAQQRDGRDRLRERRVQRRNDCRERELRRRGAVPVSRQVDRVHAMLSREARHERAPEARMHRPAVQQHEIRTLAGRLDVEGTARMVPPDPCGAYVPPDRRCAPLPPGGECLGAALRHSSRIRRADAGQTQARGRRARRRARRRRRPNELPSA